MKKLLLGMVVYSSIVVSGNITITVTGISNRPGRLSIGLYNKNNGTFTNITKAYKGIHLKIKRKTQRYTFENIPNGTYAVSIMHDENNNGKLDKNFLGIPKEGYGFSNNIRPSLRSATFDESKFILNKQKKLTIRMGY